MGFFGKRGDDKATLQHEEGDFSDSPVENVSLAAKPQAPPPPRVVEEERTQYSIDQAIELMRALPPGSDQNVELAVVIIKTTLESLKVRVADIIEDASKKQKRLEDRVSDLKKEIADFEKEIDTRKNEIIRLEADHTETTGVKKKLEMAEKAQQANAQKKKTA
jgi:hypothetical protein